MKVADRRVEERPADQAQHRIAKIAMQERHRARFDAAAESVTYYEIETFTQLGNKRIEVQKIVAVVTITYDDVAPARSKNSGAQRCAVAAFHDLNNAGARGDCERDRAVG